jgi:hypothetical protein
MELIKQLGNLVEQATSDVNNDPPIQIYEQIMDIIN